MALTVRIDKELCMSAGKCVADAPNAFGYDADELAEVLPGVAELSDDRLMRLARQCPGRAIILTDTSGSLVDF